MADLELETVFLPQPPKCWDDGSMPSCLDYLFIFVCVSVYVCAHVHVYAWRPEVVNFGPQVPTMFFFLFVFLFFVF